MSLAGAASGAGSGRTADLGRPKREQWIEELKDYKQFVTNLGLAVPPGTTSIPKVKVAILDDGAKLADLEGVQYGWPFREDDQEYCDDGEGVLHGATLLPNHRGWSHPQG